MRRIVPADEIVAAPHQRRFCSMAKITTEARGEIGLV
jgi:hypothetical protein